MNSIKQKLLYDKVSFTLPIRPKDRLTLIDKINDESFKSKYKVRVCQDGNSRYKNNYYLTICNCTVELSLYPIKKSHNFIRVEYNPDKLGSGGKRKLLACLIFLLGKDVLKEVYFKASVTRLDLTLDVYNMNPNVLIHKSRYRDSNIFRGEDKKIQSQIIGSDKSNCRITMYNKNMEQGNSSTNNYQRIEVRFRKLNYTLAEIDDKLLNVFKELNFYSTKLYKDKRLPRSFKMNVYLQGINYALNNEDTKTRAKYSQYLNDYKVYPIDVDNLSIDDAQRKAFRFLLHKGEYYKYVKHSENFIDRLKHVAA